MSSNYLCMDFQKLFRVLNNIAKNSVQRTSCYFKEVTLTLRGDPKQNFQCKRIAFQYKFGVLLIPGWCPNKLPFYGFEHV